MVRESSWDWGRSVASEGMPEAPFGGVTFPSSAETGQATEGVIAVPELMGPEDTGSNPDCEGKAGCMQERENVLRTRFVDPYKGTLAILRTQGAYHSAGQISLYKAGEWRPQVTRR